MRGLAILVLFPGLVCAQSSLHLKGFREGGRNHSISASAPKTRTPGRSHVLVQFGSNPGRDQLVELSQRGASVLSYVPDYAFSVSASQDTAFDGLDIQWVGRLVPEEKISPDLADAVINDAAASIVVEFYSDVDPNVVRSIANEVGLVIQENPDLTAGHLLFSATGAQIAALAQWDEVSYVFPASAELIQGTPVRGCAGALTTQGQVGQAVALMGDGWDGPGRGSADLKYALVHLTDQLAADATTTELLNAFSEWAKYAKLTFSATGNSTGVRTISIMFASRDHGDAYPFDGPGGVLAHTFYPYPGNPEPIAGDMHFDNDETWKIGGGNIDLFSIALHETGHALGLGHSDNPADVMYPYYRKVTALSPDDISAILQLYAAQGDTPAPVTPLALTVEAPVSPSTASSLALNGTTSGGSGAVQVSWTTSGGVSGVAQGSSSWSIASVPLNLGDNVITVTAVDSQQTQVSSNVTVTREQPAQSPLVLNIESPLSPVTSSTVDVVGTTSGGSGTVRITWMSSSGFSGAGQGSASWTIAGVPLTMGDNVIVVTAVDSQQNQVTRNHAITRKPATQPVSPLVLTIQSPQSTVNTSTVPLNGTISGGAGVVQVIWTTSAGYSGLAQGSTNWSVSSIPLNIGANVIAVLAVDAQQNEVARSISVTRLQPPSTASPLALAIQSAQSPVSATSVAISGMTSGGSGTVQVSWSSNSGYSGVAQGSAAWSIPSVPLNLGDNIITVTARDSQQAQVSRTITVTRQQPPPVNPLLLTVQSPSNPVSASSVAINGTASGGSGTLQVNWTCSAGSSGIALGSANWSIAGVPLNVGDNIIVITAIDAQKTQVSRTVTVTRQAPSGPDTIAPSLTIVSPGVSTVLTSASSIVVSGSASDNVGVTAVTWASSTGGSGTANGTSTWTTPAIPLYVGSTTITIRATDAAGNTGWRSLSVTRSQN